MATWFWRNFPLTLTLLGGMSIGSVVGYSWGFQDKNKLIIQVPCGHEECAASERSPIAPIVNLVTPLDTERIGIPVDETVEVRILMSRRVLERYQEILRRQERSARGAGHAIDKI